MRKGIDVSKIELEHHETNAVVKEISKESLAIINEKLSKYNGAQVGFLKSRVLQLMMVEHFSQVLWEINQVIKKQEVSNDSAK